MSHSFRMGRRSPPDPMNKTVRVWDSETGKAALAPLTGHTARVWSVAVSPDGKLVASGSGDNTLRIWDSHTGACPLGPIAAHSDRIFSVAFSPDGSRIVTGSVSRVESVLTERTRDTPYRIRSLPIVPAPSSAFPRSLRPGIRLGIPARAPDVIYITFPGPPAHVQAPRSFPSPPSTQPVRNLSRGSRVHNACYPRVLTNCTTSQQASVTYRAPILAPLTTNPFPDSRPYTTRLVPVSGSGPHHPSVLVSGLRASPDDTG